MRYSTIQLYFIVTLSGQCATLSRPGGAGKTHSTVTAPSRDGARMPSAEGGPLALAALLTVCIKYTPGFGARRRKLLALLHSVRQQHGLALRVIVATEIERGATLGDAYKSLLAEGSISTFVRLLPGAGLSAGRNALLRRVSTPFVALMDDDLVLHDNRSLPLLVRALMRPDASRVAIAGGCHIDLKRGVRDCFNMRFDVSADGSVVRFRRAQAAHL